MLRSTRRMARYLLKRLSKPRRMSPGRVESGEAFGSTVTRSENQAQSLRALLSASRAGMGSSHSKRRPASKWAHWRQARMAARQFGHCSSVAVATGGTAPRAARGEAVRWASTPLLRGASAAGGSRRRDSAPGARYPCCRYFRSAMRLPRERIGTELEPDDLARRPLPAFDMERRSRGVGREQALALPARVRIVDASVHPLGVEAHRIGDAQIDERAVHEGEQGLVGVAGGDRHVLAQPERVELIHPGVVTRLGAPGVGHVRELRPGKWMERPPLRAVSPGRRGPVERPLALTSVEARQMSTRQRRPGDAVAIDVHAAWPVSGQWRLEYFRQGGGRRIRPRIETNDIAREAQHRAPHGSVEGVDADAVEGRRDPLVFSRIEGLVGLHIVVPLAVAVGIQDERCPALGFRLVAGLLEHLPIQPADDAALRAAGTRP